MRSISLSLSSPVHAALEANASGAHMRASDRAVRIIEDYLINHGLLDNEAEGDIHLARSLIDRAVERALSLVESGGLCASITFDAIQSVSADPDWLRDYAALVRDDPYKTGSPRKQTINQNLGYFIKKALRARSVMLTNGKPSNIKVKGSIIQSHTPLKL